MLSVKEAQAHILSAFSILPPVEVGLRAAAGLVLAEEIISDVNLPPFTNSSMDGFAVRSADLTGASREQPALLTVIADIAAGRPPVRALNPGEAARIMTGAPLPENADAVIPVEDTDFPPNMPDTALPDCVKVFRSLRPGDYIRPEGQDVRAGQAVLQAGRELQAQDIGVLAALGHATVRVIPKPRVAIFSSGDELVEPGEPLGPGQIRNSNSYLLAAMIEKHGGEVTWLPVARDRPEDVRDRFEQAVAAGVHFVLTSAGVSVGAYDYVRGVVEEAGQLEFWRVNMRPGKPLAFGSYKGVPVIGLPGNPVSAYVGCRVFVLPVLAKLSGRTALERETFTARLSEAIESDGRESYLRALVTERDGVRYVRLAGHQGSGNLVSLVRANALLIVPSGVKSLAFNSEVEIWYLDR